MNVRPLHDRIIVQRIDEGEQKIGGIIIPDTAKEKPQQGKVIAAGKGKVKDDGKVVQWSGLGTIKSQIGHTKAAAGAAGLLKVILALHQKVLPPTIKVEAPNPELEIETSPIPLPFSVQHHCRDRW